MSQPTMTVRFAKGNVTLANSQWPSTLLNNLDKMRQENNFCDVSLEVPLLTPDGEKLKHVFNTHACVLAAASKLFQGILAKEVKQRHVIMKAFEEDALRYCLSYIYGQEIKVPYDRVHQLRKASETLELKSLTAQCGVVLDTLKLKPELWKKMKPRTPTPTKTASSCYSPSSATAEEQLAHCSEAPHPPADNDNHETFDKDARLPCGSPDEDVSEFADEKEGILKQEKETCVELEEPSANLTSPADSNVQNEISKEINVKSEDMQSTPCRAGVSNDSSLYVEILPLEPPLFDDFEEQRADDDLESEIKQERTESDQQISELEESEDGESGQRSRKRKRRATKISQFKCDHCDQFFATKGSLVQHKKRLAENPDWVPRPRGKKSEEELRKTRNECRARLELKKYTCKECGEELQGFKRLFRHRRKFHEKLYVCQHCANVLVTERELRMHEERCGPKQKSEQVSAGHGEPVSKAKIPRRKAAPGENAPENESKKTKATKPKEKFMCDHCGTLFATKAYFKKHLERVAENPDYVPRKQAKQSYAEFRRKHNALRAKYEKKEYECKECGEILLGFRRLNVHRQRVHRKSHVCQYCKKVFEFPALLKIHEKRHRNEKDFMCTQCDYRAITMHEVKFHEQREHLNLQFLCTQCPAVFRSQNRLSAHERQHKKGPLKCQYCDYVTVQQNSLKMHIVNKHFPEQRETFLCNICQRTFSQRGHLSRHVKAVHGATLPHKTPSNKLALTALKDDESVAYDETNYDDTQSTFIIDPHAVQESGEIAAVQYAAEHVQLGHSLESNNIIMHEAQSATENLIIQEVDELDGVVYYYADDASVNT